MIVVVDTNVCIAAFNFSSKRGTPVLALDKAVEEDTIVLCDEIESEIVHVLSQKFRWDDARIREALDILGANAIRVKIYGTVSLCRDPDDNKILECAERVNADLIVTGDKDLLSVGTHGQTKILTPSEYLNLE